MSEELVFYTNPMSRGRIIRWMLEEVGQPYRTEIIEYGPQMKSPPYTDINPMGKVPAIRHGDAVVTECAAICAYLADAFPQAGLAPAPGSRDRAPYYRWLFFSAGPAEAAIINNVLGFVTPPERRTDGRLWLAFRRCECAGESGFNLGLFSRRPVYRSRSLCRVADRIRAAVRHHRAAPRF